MSPDAPFDWPRENRGPASPSADGSLPATAAAARARARGALRHRVDRVDRNEDAVTERAVTDILIVVSELFTNALRHGGGITRFGVSVEADVFRVTVGDLSADLPQQRNTTDPDTRSGGEGGYGWPLVRELATEITLVLERGGGKLITVTLPLS